MDDAPLTATTEQDEIEEEEDESQVIFISRLLSRGNKRVFRCAKTVSV